MNKFIIIALAVLAGAILATSTAITATQAANEDKMMSAGKGSMSKYYKDGVFMIKAGGGGAYAPHTKFSPKVAEIKAGESVTWYNPTKVPEPHTVTFIFDQSKWANLEAPFAISNSTSVTPLAPGSNAEAMTFPGPSGTAMVGANARAFIPTTIKPDDAATYLPPNATYTMDGTEKYVNSGFMWPKGKTPEGLQDISTFTVKFEKAGTYDYICIIHPWMTGRVVVN